MKDGDILLPPRLSPPVTKVPYLLQNTKQAGIDASWGIGFLLFFFFLFLFGCRLGGFLHVGDYYQWKCNTPALRVVVQSSYVVEVNNEHVILGNSAMLKCTIPSFVTDFVYVASWTISDERGELANLDTQSTGIFS